MVNPFVYCFMSDNFRVSNHVVQISWTLIVLHLKLCYKDNFCRILTMVCWYWTNCTFGLYPSSGFVSSTNSGNASFHSVQSILSSRLLCEYLKVKTYKTVILPVAL
jgi:hypothetical protein